MWYNIENNRDSSPFLENILYKNFTKATPNIYNNKNIVINFIFTFSI